MKHCMLDLETWGLAPGSALRSIGATMFDPFSEKIGNKFYCNVSRESCVAWGLTVDPKTEAWWLSQSDEAKAALVENQKSLSTALADFTNWYVGQGAEFIWSHGANFDVPILEAAYKAAWLSSVPWHYRSVRDTRTVYWLGGVDLDMQKCVGVKHDALHDAINQARAVQDAIKQIFPPV